MEFAIKTLKKMSKGNGKNVYDLTLHSDLEEYDGSFFLTEAELRTLKKTIETVLESND